MSTFKQRLRKLLSNSFICNDESSSNNPDKSFHETLNSTKRILHKNLKKNNSSLNIYNNYNNNNNNNYNNKNFLFINSNRQLYPSLFTIKNLKKEKIGKINTLMRSISLKDIHNHIENNSLNLSRSYSSLDLSFNNNDNNNFKKKLENLKKNFGLDDPKNNTKLNINRPIRNLRLHLYNINISDIINMSPSLNRIQKINFLKKNNFKNLNNKRLKYKYINYPIAHKFNSRLNNNNINKF